VGYHCLNLDFGFDLAWCRRVLTEPQEQSPHWRTSTIVLAVVVMVLLGLIIGYLALGDSREPAAVGSTTTVTSAQSSTSSVPRASTTTSFEPTTTTLVPPGTPLPTQPPDTSVDGQVTFTAVEDTYIDSGDTTRPRGFDPGLVLENDPPELKLGLIRFDVVGLPEGVEIESAVLRLYVEVAGDDALTVHGVVGEWTEAETTAVDSPEIGATVATIPPGFPDLDYVEVEVTDLIDGDGLVDIYVATSSPRTTELGSRETPGPPQLIVSWDE
jgi:hypothetical protein